MSKPWIGTIRLWEPLGMSSTESMAVDEP
jgi:hypothetical protein